MTNDYFGAREVGWNSLLVDRWGGGHTTIDQDQVIENMMEVFSRDSFQ